MSWPSSVLLMLRSFEWTDAVVMARAGKQQGGVAGDSASPPPLRFSLEMLKTHCMKAILPVLPASCAMEHCLICLLLSGEQIVTCCRKRHPLAENVLCG